MKSFFQHGLPPLGERSGSKSRGSASKEEHKDAVLIEHSFGILPDETIKRQDSPFCGFSMNIVVAVVIEAAQVTSKEL